MYGCAATFAGVWVIASEPTSNEPDVEGSTSDVDGEGHSLHGTPTVGVRRIGGVAALRTRRSTVSLVGISPAQVLLDFY